MKKNSLNEGLLRINGKIRAHEIQVLKEKKVTLTQREFDYLGTIVAIKSPKMSVLVDYMGVEKGTFSNTVKRMLEKGYVEFELINDDKRAKRILLTNKGKNAIKIRNEIRSAYFDKIVSEIGMIKTEELLETMHKLAKIL